VREVEVGNAAVSRGRKVAVSRYGIWHCDRWVAFGLPARTSEERLGICSGRAAAVGRRPGGASTPRRAATRTSVSSVTC